MKTSIKYSLRAIVLTMVLTAPALATAQTAKGVLDKAAAAVTAKEGAQASFAIKGSKLNTSGQIAVKGRKFRIAVPDMTIWFDGTNQWTYVKKNDEVNLSNPSDGQSLLPYAFIYIYKEGYQSTLTKKSANYEVHLTTADKKKNIQEMYVTVNQKTYVPTQIRMKQKDGWTTIDISGFKSVKLGDQLFRFPAKDYPTAEVIDLR